MCYSLTTFECILLASTFVKLAAVESPAVGDTRWLCEAAAATGTENKDMKRGDALRKAEANTLAACTRVSYVCGLQAGVWKVTRKVGCVGRFFVVLQAAFVEIIEDRRRPRKIVEDVVRSSCVYRKYRSCAKWRPRLVSTMSLQVGFGGVSRSVFKR